jgi:hypothetical protein
METPNQSPDQPQDTESETTGLPGLRSWPSVYLLVTAIFILWVGLLVALERFFS